MHTADKTHLEAKLNDAKWLPIYRPKLLPRETLLWRRDPLDFAQEISVSPATRLVFGALSALLLVLIGSNFTAGHPVWWLGLLAALVSLWYGLMPPGVALKGGLIAHTLTDQRLVLSPWRSIRLRHLDGARAKGDRVLVKSKGRYYQFGPLRDAGAVSDRINQLASGG